MKCTRLGFNSSYVAFYTVTQRTSDKKNRLKNIFFPESNPLYASCAFNNINRCALCGCVAFSLHKQTIIELCALR